jgi:2-oxoglutarate dehydrogenase E2 component (dihydrolipoamide succinyltransferase)
VRQVIFEYAGDDVSTATVDYWHIDEGDAVEEGDDLVELRTEEGDLLVLPAPTGGVLRERFFEQGDEVELGDVIATIEDGLEELEEVDDEEEEEEEEEEEVEDDEEHEEDDIESFADDEEL